MRQLSGGSEDCPHPGASHAMTVNSSARSSSCHLHDRLSSMPPWSKTSGSPAPASEYMTRCSPMRASFIALLRPREQHPASIDEVALDCDLLTGVVPDAHDSWPHQRRQGAGL